VTQHAGLPVAGYTTQSDAKVSLVNENKALEERVLRQIDRIDDNFERDLRWASIARTHIEQGFMALNRAVFQPQRVKLPEDAED
jgi:hypothetical protein